MQNTPFSVRPINKQLFQLHTEQSHPRLSLRRVLYVKFLRWIEKSTFKSLLMACAKCSMLLLSFALILAPSFTLGVLTASAQWNGYRIPLCFAIVLLTANATRLYGLVKHLPALRSKRSSNQHTYHGIPCDELTSYLFERRTFGTSAMNELALPQRKWSKIADELETHGILVRGENNARVLADITREQLVKQLREGFPLVFDPVGKQWCEKRGGFDRWVLDRERKEAKEAERIAKLERKEGRLRSNIERLREEGSVFQNIMALNA